MKCSVMDVFPRLKEAGKWNKISNFYFYEALGVQIIGPGCYKIIFGHFLSMLLRKDLHQEDLFKLSQISPPNASTTELVQCLMR